jgi:hypothetical protein
LKNISMWLINLALFLPFKYLNLTY